MKRKDEWTEAETCTSVGTHSSKTQRKLEVQEQRTIFKPAKPQKQKKYCFQSSYCLDVPTCVCVQIVFHGSWILYLSGAILVLWLCHQSDKERISSKSGIQIWFWSKSSAHQMLKFEIDSTRKQQQNHYRWLLPTWSLLTNYMNEKRIVLLLLLSLVGLSLESFPLCIWVWLVGLKFLASVLLSVWK